MNTAFRRLPAFALLALLVGFPHALRARDLPPCEFDLQDPGAPPGLGGGGCHVEARPSEVHIVGSAPVDIELAPHHGESSFHVVIDQRELRLSDRSDWFRILELQTRDSGRDSRWLWYVEVANGTHRDKPQVRVVSLRQTGSGTEPIATEDPVYLRATGPCTRLEGLWLTREDGGHTHTQLSLRSSIPNDCESPDGDIGQPHTLVYRNIGIPSRLSLGAIRPAHHASLVDQGFVRLNLFDPTP